MTIARKPTADKAAAPKRRTTTATPVDGALPAAVKPPGSPRKKAAAAGPRKKAAEARVPAQLEWLDRIQGVVVASLEDDKAEDIVVLDLSGRASFADRMVIATGLADRQISAMATHLEEELEKAGIKRVLIEGAGGSDWVLIDVGDIIVHLFKAEARALYALEKMWGAELDEPVATDDVIHAPVAADFDIEGDEELDHDHENGHDHEAKD